MMVFPMRIEHALEMAVDRSHDANPRNGRRQSEQYTSTPRTPAARISAKVIFWRTAFGMAHDRPERAHSEAAILSRIAAHPAHRLDELLPWNWTPPASAISAQAA
jgi:hypothetical protein